MIGYLVCVETKTELIRFEFFLKNGDCDDEEIKKQIHEKFTDHECTNIGMKEVEQILVIATDGHEVSVYEPKIEDVWPLDFDNKEEPKFFKKGGE